MVLDRNTLIKYIFPDDLYACVCVKKMYFTAKVCIENVQITI